MLAEHVEQERDKAAANGAGAWIDSGRKGKPPRRADADPRGFQSEPERELTWWMI